jgi:hypothetical protein
MPTWDRSWLLSSFLLIAALATNTASSFAQAPAAGQALRGPANVVAAPSYAHVRLDRVFYKDGERVGVSLIAEAGYIKDETVYVFAVGSASRDVEVVKLQGNADRTLFSSVDDLKIASRRSILAKPANQTLEAAPGELIYAIYLPEYRDRKEAAGKAQFVFDFAQVLDPAAKLPSVAILPELGFADDKEPKPSGTLLLHDDLPVRLPVDELIFYPGQPRDLQRFLEETKGRVVAHDGKGIVPKSTAEPEAYLVRLDASKEDISLIPAMRALMGKDERTLYASNEAVLKLVALAMRMQLKGHIVAANPRVYYGGGPTTQDHPGYIPPLQITDPMFAVNRAWVLTALLDRDTARIQVGFIDQGFSRNADFRGFPGGIECDFQGASEIAGILSGFHCGPGTAFGPPTTGDSFFGGRSWHGNMTVTAAGAVLNNGFGAAGVAGQVMQPALYRFGVASYAFEIGLGIQKAVADNCSVINISAGYPCTLLLSLGLSPGICGTGERFVFCESITLGLFAAAVALCASAVAVASLPFVGPILAIPLFIACGVSTAAAIAAQGACLALLVPGDVRGTMQRGVDQARAAGIPVIANSGNRINRGNLPPIVSDIVNTTNMDASAWRIIPCTLNGVICVGAIDPASGPAFSNTDFNGPAVHIWAPDGVTVFAPPTTAADAPPGAHVVVLRGGATSAATAYVSGVVALLQAIDPDLDPQRTGRTGSAVERIPTDILSVLQATAAPPFVGTPATSRGLLVRPFMAVQSAARTIAPRVLEPRTVRGYGTELDFDEFLRPSHDRREDALDLGVSTLGGYGVPGTVHRIPPGPPEPGGPGVGRLSTDVDWFRFRMPPEEGLWKGRIEFSYPAVAGVPTLQSELSGELTRTAVVRSSGPGADETAWFETPPLTNDAEVRFFVGAMSDSEDNVYYVNALYPVRVGDLPLGDRFDRDDPSMNPPESRPNNNTAARAVILGARSDAFAGELSWMRRSAVLGERFAIDVAGLNFHRRDDEDHFRIDGLPRAEPHPDAPGCSTLLTITAGPGVRIRASLDGRLLAEEADRPLRIENIFSTEVGPATPIMIALRETMPGRLTGYSLSLAYSTPPAVPGLGPVPLQPPTTPLPPILPIDPRDPALPGAQQAPRAPPVPVPR